MQAESSSDISLRVAVRGGGCSGFTYQFSFEKGHQEDDLRFVCADINLTLETWLNSATWQKDWREYLRSNPLIQVPAKVVFLVLEHYGRHALSRLVLHHSQDPIDGVSDEDLKGLLIATNQFVLERQASCQQSEIQICIDPISFIYLNDAMLDYAEDNRGKRFIVSNPNAKTSCGCGSSFSPY